MPRNSKFYSEPVSDFISTLHSGGWHSLISWADDGNTFELLIKGRKRILVHIYPEDHGFEVWRPVTDSSSIRETAEAVASYEQEEPKDAA